MEDFERELKLVFLDEAMQIVAEAEQCYLALESNPDDRQIIEKLFRLAHNLKGSSKAVGFDELGGLTHELESFLLKIKSNEISISTAAANLLLRCNDQLTQMVQGLRDDLNARFDIAELVNELQQASLGQTNSSDEKSSFLDTPPSSENTGWGLFESVSEAESVQKSFEPAITKPALSPALAKTSTPPASGADESIRISLARLEKLINFVGEVVILQTVLKEQVQSTDNHLLRKTVQQLGKVTKEVQEISMSLRMVPLRQTFQKMQRIVRDTSAALDKKVNLILQGEDTELDKTILEKVSDPLVHLIRNAIDHGIECPEIRIKNGKEETGTVQLFAYHQSGKLVIEVKDDGYGLDPSKLKAKALEKGLIRADQVISDKEALNLVFKPGFSTKAVVTDVSGRGVGMDVVKTNIEALQGEVQLDSELGKGSCIKIVLPLTLAIIDGLIIKAGEERYVFPLTQVFESVRPGKDDIHHSTGLGDIFSLRGETMPLFSLSHLIGRGPAAKSPWDSIAIVVRTLEKPFAVLVDDIFGQNQIVIKKLGEEHRDLVGISGSAILGDGKAALILELGDLVKASKQSPSTRHLRRVA